MDFIFSSPIPTIVNYLALAVGLWALFMRGRAIAALSPGAHTKKSVKTIFNSNNIWYLAVLLWIITSLILFGRTLDMGFDWYLENFWIRFNSAPAIIFVFILEFKLMILFIRWRLSWKKFENSTVQIDKSQLRSLVIFNKIELALVALISILSLSRYGSN